MREIKFRLRLNNKMVGCEKWYSGSNKDGNWVAKPQWLYSANRKNWSPRYIFHNAKDLFTGLNDKNGKEIYEGDIVESSVMLGVVVWQDDCMKFIVNDTRRSGFLNFIATANINGAEVIGNIYENPKLLKGEK